MQKYATNKNKQKTNKIKKINLKEKLEFLVNKKIPNLLEGLYKQNFVHNDCFVMEKPNLRGSFLDMKLVNLHYVTKDHGWIETYSSSDDEIEDGVKINSSASMKDVCENIIDLNTFMIIVKKFF